MNALPSRPSWVRRPLSVRQPGVVRRPDRVRRPSVEQLIVAGIVLASGLASAWNIGHAGYSTFYSTATRSMAISWRALVFGAFDPRATITLDKLAGFLVPQALSARLFGFHPWSIALPQVFEGMVTVAAAAVIAHRWKGPRAAVLAALAVASTPLLPSMFGHEMEDGLLTMSLALALLCWQSAVLHGRLRSLLLCAFWVAIGFQAKMMQAWLIVPGLAVGYLLAAPQSIGHRLGRGALTAGVLFGLSISWMTALQLVPAAHRPYIDGSTNNNAFAMVFGYNGFNRLLPNLVPGAIGNSGSAHRALKSVAPGLKSGISQLAPHRPHPLPPGMQWGKLLLPYYTTQVGWLYPAALAGLALPVVGLVRRRRLVLADRESLISTSTALVLGCWLLLCAGVLTIASVPHTAYFAAITVQVGLLASAGLVDAIGLHRGHGWPSRAALPLLILAETLWTALILIWHDNAPGLLLPAVLLIGLASSAALAVPGRYWRGLTASDGRWRTGLVATGLIAVFLAPIGWTGYVLDPARNGTAGEAYTGPKPAGTAHAAAQRYRIGVPFSLPADPTLSLAQRRLVRYLRAHTKPGEVLMITDQWTTASVYILDGGLAVQTMGGFSGRAPTPTLAQLQRMIRSGRLRFALLTDRKPLTEFNYVVQLDRSWLRDHCSPVQPSDYGGPSHSLLGLLLYSCTRGAGDTSGSPAS